MRNKNQDLLISVKNLREESAKLKDTTWLLSSILEKAEKAAVGFESVQNRLPVLLEGNQSLTQEVNRLISENNTANQNYKSLLAKNKSLEAANEELRGIVKDLKSKLQNNEVEMRLEKRVIKLKGELAAAKEQANRLASAFENSKSSTKNLL